MSLATLRNDQPHLARRLFADVRFRAPLLIIWVTSFYYMALCGDKIVVGRIYSGLSSALLRCFGVVPLYY